MNSRKLPTYAMFALMLAAGAVSAGTKGNPPAAGTKPASGEQRAAAGEHPHKMAQLHGGQVTKTKRHHFETVFGVDGIRVYLYSDQQTPLLADKTAGSVMFQFPEGKSKTVVLAPQPAKDEDVFFCTMHPNQVARKAGACPECRMKLVPQTSLFAMADLSKVVQGGLKAQITLDGLEGEESPLTFTETYHGPAKTMNQ